MAAIERFEGMGDVRLKPRILRNLLSEHVPHEEQPLSNPLALSNVVSSIQTHKLLSESSPESTDKKLVEKWKSTIDDWVDRLLALISSNMPDKCWAAICLMGVTFQECSSDRFFASYSVWFDKILSHIRNPEGSRMVRIASCAALSDLLTRLAKFSNAKKDAVSHAAKLIQPILKLLEDDSSEALWEGALHLLCTIIIFFPASLHANYDKVEATVASKILSAKTSDDMLKKFAHFLALLPKAKGDEASWSLMMQKFLIYINVQLNNFFQGLEEETKGKKAISLLIPPGKEIPLLGGSKGSLDDATMESEQLIISRVSAVMLSCSTILTSSYKAKLNIPIRSVILLVERVLEVNGSIPRTISPFMTPIQQELVCAELPLLHSSALDLLLSTLKSIRSQLLPYAASVVRLISSYFKKCQLPELRIKLYTITKTLLISMGVGMAMQLAQEVVINASADLKPMGAESYNQEHQKEASRSRKRKHCVNTGMDTQLDNPGLEVEGFDNDPNFPISLKVAALEALETLLTIGGALGSETWRGSVDRLIITTASNVCNAKWAIGEINRFLPNRLNSGVVELQFASLRALLASLLSPSRVRPESLAEGLELFRTGKMKAETKVAEFCAHALLCLEVLIHPRALPVDDLPSLSNRGPSIRKNAFLDANDNDDDDDDDDLFNKWTRNDNLAAGETTVSVPETKKSKVGDIEVMSESIQDDEDVAMAVPETAENSRKHVLDGSEDVEADVAMAVPETVENAGREYVSDKPVTKGRQGEAAGNSDRPVTKETREAAGKSEKLVNMERRRENAENSEEGSMDSVPSLQDDDYLSSSESDDQSIARNF